MNQTLTPVIKNLLIINGLVWLAQIVFAKQGYPLEIYGGLWGLETGNFKVWQLVSYMFMHEAVDAAGQIVFAHILFNMFALWMFGNILENVWGSKRFFTFYMICGIGAGIVQLIFQKDFVAIGASGAIMGVMAAFVYLFPNTSLYIMFIPIPIKAKYVIPGFMLLDLFGSIAPRQGDNVAHWAHLGGAIVGLILVIIWNRSKSNRNNFY
ncbi:MAG TPA: rhomboid family intramembrane serine protease [Puia sp.]|jgi:membrane associated rhomboid family serine protease|nr:rhomboid family intramembrane serine protease [Puia sp.]